MLYIFITLFVFVLVLWNTLYYKSGNNAEGNKEIVKNTKRVIYPKNEVGQGSSGYKPATHIHYIGDVVERKNNKETI